MKRSSVSLIAAAALAAAAGAGIVLARQGDRGAPTPAATQPPAPAAARQLWHCGMHPQVVQDHPGDCPICHMALTPFTAGGGARAADRKILYWWDPMLGPSSVSDHPGKSAMGMDLVPVYAESAGPDVRIDPRVVQNMGVRTAEVTRGTLTKTVRTVGLLSLPEPGLHDVSLKVSGWVDKLYADQEGMRVNEGDPLFAVYSPDVQVASQELISAVRALRSLPPDAPDAVRREAQAMVESAERKLRLWDVDERDVREIAAAPQPPRDVVFRSPAGGHVEEKMVVQGASVQPGMKLLRVADHSKMWLDLQVYEGQLPFVKAGQPVCASVAGVPGKAFQGNVSFLYPRIDPTTRTLKVRATLDNPDFELKPGMYASAEIRTEPVANATLVPREAVIDTGTRQIAFVAEGGGHFSARKVRTGLAGDGDSVQIVDGLAPGETVVTSGQFLLDVESRTIEATEKLSGGGSNVPPALPPAEPVTGPARAPSDAPSTGPAATAPASAPAPTAEPRWSEPLTLVYCPMVKADWLQEGERIENPYLGRRMPGCGEVKKKVPPPKQNPQLARLVEAYLAAAKGLKADAPDPAAAESLEAAAEKLAADQYGPLKRAAADFARAGDLQSAREAFKALSRELRSALGEP